MEAEDDSAVMQAVQRGDLAKLAILFDRYHVALFRYLLHLSGNRSLSEDLVQDAFFRVLKYAHSYDPTQCFRVWLFGAARNTFLDAMRKRRTELSIEDAQEPRSTEPMPEEKIVRDQELRHLEHALAKLPVSKREVLILSRFHDLRYEEIGRILNIDAGAVKVRVYRALRELREMFCELRGEKTA